MVLTVMKVMSIRLVFVVCIALLIGVQATGFDDSLIVDISSLFAGGAAEDALDTIDKLEAAFRTHGVVLLKGHGITREDRQAYFDAVGELIGLGIDDKLAVKANPKQAIGRGYIPFGAESGLSEYLEPKEGYSYGYPQNKGKGANKMASANIWPASLSQSSQNTLSRLFIQLTDVATAITNTIVNHRNALAVSQPRKRTDITSDKGKEISLLRVFHYFSQASEQFNDAFSDAQRIGSSPHTDWGLLTLIIPNPITGLQYVHNHTWINVPYIEDTVAMNVGDFFSLATKGEYHSPIHRVLCPETENRISFVLFFYPNYDSILTLPTEEESKQVCNAMESSQCDSQQQEQEQDMTYNTLLSKHNLAGRGEQVKFGDYIVEKWEGVTRSY